LGRLASRRPSAATKASSREFVSVKPAAITRLPEGRDQDLYIVVLT
jgi:hypothetical protein